MGFHESCQYMVVGFIIAYVMNMSEFYLDLVKDFPCYRYQFSVIQVSS